MGLLKAERCRPRQRFFNGINFTLSPSIFFCWTIRGMVPS
jgi:hypothetical protein